MCLEGTAQKVTQRIMAVTESRVPGDTLAPHGCFWARSVAHVLFLALADKSRTSKTKATPDG